MIYHKYFDHQKRLTNFCLQEQNSGFSTNPVEKSHPMPALSSRVKMEGLSDSPLGHRPRSSTVSSAGGDSMRREFMARRAAAKQKVVSSKIESAVLDKTESASGSQVSAKRNMYVFLEVYNGVCFYKLIHSSWKVVDRFDPSFN